MLLISPELLDVVYRFYDDGKSYMNIDRRFAEKLRDKFSWRRLCRNLKNLGDLGFLRIEYFSHRKIQARVLRREFFVELIGIFDRVGRIDFELSERALRILHIASTSPYAKDIDMIAMDLGLTRKGTRKIIYKLQRINFLDSDMNITRTGMRILYLFYETPLKEILELSTNPFLNLPLFEGKIDRDVVDYLRKSLLNIIDKNSRYGKIVNRVILIGLDSHYSLSMLLKDISMEFNIPCLILPIILPEHRMHRLVAMSGRIWSNSWLCRDDSPLSKLGGLTEIDLLINFIESSMTKERNTLFVIFTPPAISYLINYILLRCFQNNYFYLR